MVFAQSTAGLILLFGISGGEILILLLVVLILFGPSKIPEMARMLGRGINEVKKVQREINTEIHRYSSEIEKETSKMQSEINDMKEQVSKTADAVASDKGEGEKAKTKDPAREPRPDAYEEARANDPQKAGDKDESAPPADSVERADALRKSMGEKDTHGSSQEPSKGQGDDNPASDGLDDLPYPYNQNRDGVD